VRRRLGGADWCVGARGEEGATKRERVERRREDCHRRCPIHAGEPPPSAVASSHGRAGGREKEIFYCGPLDPFYDVGS